MRSSASHSATLVSAIDASGSPASASAPQVTTTASGEMRSPSGSRTSSTSSASSASLNPFGTGRLIARPPPIVAGIAAVGPAAGFVDRQRNDARVVGKRILHAVAVMGVEVDVEDPVDTAAQQPQDREHRVVEIAEAARAIAAPVVRATGRIERRPGRRARARRRRSNRRPRSMRARTIPRTADSPSCRSRIARDSRRPPRRSRSPRAAQRRSRRNGTPAARPRSPSGSSRTRPARTSRARGRRRSPLRRARS